MDNKGLLGMSGEIKALVQRAARPHTAHTLVRVPGIGRLMFTKDTFGSARIFADQVFATRLVAYHYDGDGKLIGQHDLGSGVVTNVGTFAMCNDFGWSASLNLSTLGTQNFVATGTGATAATINDFRCQTLASPTTTTGVTGTQSLVAPTTFVGPVSPIFKNVATVNYISTLAITEWGLHSLATLSSSTGTPFTATTTSTWQDTGSAQTASSATVRGLQQTIILPGTTTVLGLNLSNTTHVGTIASSATTGWYTQATQANGSPPGATEAFTVIQVMWDHKVFAAINVNNGDSIQFTYSLSVNGGT